jgi:hypothetical protein
MESPAFIKAELRESIEDLANESCGSYLLVPWSLLINDIETA